LNGFTNDLPADLSMTGNITFNADPCDGDAADNPIWLTESALDWSASGTLANGLTVAVDHEAAITLSGAFGSLQWKNNGDSAVKAAHVGGDGDITVAGGAANTFGGHALATSGTAGYVVNWTAPSVGGLDLYLSYAPSSGNSDLNDDNYLDTLAIGTAWKTDMMSLSFGYETATANANADTGNECSLPGAITISDGTANIDAATLINLVYGTDTDCGDQTLTVIGASVNAADFTISGGYSNLDTEEADRATTSLNLSTTVSDWSVGLGYTSSTKSSYVAGADTVQTAIAATIGTSLGDGVDLGITLSNNKIDDESQSVDRGGNGATNDFLAQAKLTIKY